MSQVLLSPPASAPLADHPPELRFLWLRHVARGGGAWCFRHSGRGYGGYTTKAEADADHRGIIRFTNKENSNA